MTPELLAPRSLAEALQARAERGAEATVLAGGTFLAVLIGQRLLEPTCLLSLHAVARLDGIDVAASGELTLGAMTRHRAVERSAAVRAGWPALAEAFAVVASPRVRNQATVGGVLADADYASDPPAMLCALGASAVLASVRGARELAVEELILGHYETALATDELLVSVRVPAAPGAAVYRKFRSRSHEDRPCVSVAAARREGRLRIVVGAVAGRPQHLPDICALASGQALDGELARDLAAAYAAAIDPIGDVRGSAAYRRRVIAVEVRRALEQLAALEASGSGPGGRADPGSCDPGVRP